MDSKGSLGLSKIVEEWMRDHERRNLKMLSRLSGVPYTSLRRIVQNEVDPNLDQALSILAYVASSDQRLAYLQHNFPESARVLKSTLSNRDGSANAVEGQDSILERYVDDPDYVVLAMLADSHHGLSSEALSKEFGRSGASMAQRLVDEEILEEDFSSKPSLFRVRSKPRLQMVTLSTTIKLVRAACDLFLKTRRAVAYYHNQSLNDDGLYEIKQIMTDAYQKVARVMEDKKYQGDNCICFTMTCGKYYEFKENNTKES